MHTNYFAYESADAAARGAKEHSSNYMTLSGIWKFFWVKNADARPTDFWKVGFNDKGWSDMACTRGSAFLQRKILKIPEKKREMRRLIE